MSTRMSLARPLSLYAGGTRAVSRPTVAAAAGSYRSARRVARTRPRRPRGRRRPRALVRRPGARHRGARAPARPGPRNAGPGERRAIRASAPAALPTPARGRAPPRRCHEPTRAVGPRPRPRAPRGTHDRRSRERGAHRGRPRRRGDPVPWARPSVAGMTTGWGTLPLPRRWRDESRSDPREAVMRGGDLIAEYLVRENVPYVFGLCGHGIVGLMDALGQRADRIKMIGAHHEQVAGYMADAYYRVAH